MGRVLVIGASGFIGSALCDMLTREGHHVRAALRGDRAVKVNAAEVVSVGEICETTDWDAALEGVEMIVHAAARTHVVRDRPENSKLYFRTNTLGTSRIAAAAARAGVRRFVFLSSIKVNGEKTTDRPYTATDAPAPQDAYGFSKWLAEERLLELASQVQMEVVILRPPLVYGPGVRANFLRLMREVDRGRLLPLGAIANRRSLVNIWNLCDLICQLLAHPRAAGRIWLVSDGEDLSTPELVKRIGNAMGRRARLLSIPVRALEWAGGAVGHKSEVARLCGSLVVDIVATRCELNWTPSVSVEEGLARTAQWYLHEGYLGGT